MNSRFIYTVILTLCVILAASSCGNKNNNEHQINPKVAELDSIRDTSLHVKLKKVANDSIYVTGIEGNYDLVYGISEALAEGKVIGSLTPGNEYRIYSDNKHTRITICVNTTELSGRWFFDLQKHRGFTFDSNGVMSTINTEEISFRQWKLLEGKIYIYYVDMQQDAPDRHEFLVEEAEIIHLSKDALEFNLNGKYYNCRHENRVLKFGEQ